MNQSAKIQLESSDLQISSLNLSNKMKRKFAFINDGKFIKTAKENE